MISAGPISTTTDSPVTLLTLTAGYWTVVLLNLGTGGGYFSIDSGTTWGELPAGPTTTRTLDGVYCPVGQTVTVQVKRIPSGSNLTLISGDAQETEPPIEGLPNVWYVRSGGNDSSAGNTVAAAFLTSAQAFSVAQFGDVVNIQLGIAYVTPPPGVRVVSPFPNEQ